MQFVICLLHFPNSSVITWAPSNSFLGEKGFFFLYNIWLEKLQEPRGLTAAALRVLSICIILLILLKGVSLDYITSYYCESKDYNLVLLSSITIGQFKLLAMKHKIAYAVLTVWQFVEGFLEDLLPSRRQRLEEDYCSPFFWLIVSSSSKDTISIANDSSTNLWNSF